MTTFSSALARTDAPASSHWRTAAALIDSTLLRPDATREQSDRLCQEALFYRFAAVFVPPTWLAYAAWALNGSGVKVGSPVGFPLGATLSSVKHFEALELLRMGAAELDMMLNVSALKSGERTLVQTDIAGVVRVAHDAGALVKVILETGLLDLHEKILACELAVAAGADFVKTSTGLNGGGATAEDVALLRGVVGGRAGVKASGGIRTAEQFTALTHAGADRIGTSDAVAILRQMGAPELP